jgi:hypothetical protein
MVWNSAAGNNTVNASKTGDAGNPVTTASLNDPGNAIVTAHGDVLPLPTYAGNSVGSNAAFVCCLGWE